MLSASVRAVAEVLLRPSRAFLLSLIASLAVAAFGIGAAEAAEPGKPAPPPGKALVYIYRPSSLVETSSPTHFALDGIDVANLNPKTYTWMYVSEKTHVLRYQRADSDQSSKEITNWLEGLAIDTRAGGTYYYRFDQYTQSFLGRFEVVQSITQIPPEQARQELGQYRLVAPYNLEKLDGRTPVLAGAAPSPVPAPSVNGAPPAAARPAPPVQSEPLLSPQQAATYKLQAGDRLLIDTLNEPENTGAFVVNGAGMISMKYIGDVPARGRTANELGSAIVAKLAYGYELKPQVRVDVVAPGQPPSRAK